MPWIFLQFTQAAKNAQGQNSKLSSEVQKDGNNAG
jgi:hypothetical protein